MIDGQPLPEFSKKCGQCPHCIGEMIYMGHGYYKEEFTCYCEGVGEVPFALDFPDMIDEEERSWVREETSSMTS